MIPLKRVQLYWREIFRPCALFRGSNLNACSLPLRDDRLPVLAGNLLDADKRRKAVGLIRCPDPQ